MDTRIALCFVFSLLVVGQGAPANEEPEDLSQRGFESTSGALYTRWGRGECPSTSTQVYSGIAAGPHHGQRGSGANYLCLHLEPIYDDTVVKGYQKRGELYSVEYEGNSFPPIASLEHHDVPCTVCEAKQRSNVLMIPGRSSCPNNWTREYDGYLMSSEKSGHRSEYVCVDKHASDRSATSGNSANSDFYPVEGRCSKNGGLPCGPYRDGAELTCVVCSK